MAVVEVNQLWDGESGGDTIDRVRKYTTVYEVITDNPGDDATVAGGPTARALGLPGNGYQYPNDSAAFLVAIDPARTSESPYRWIVTCNYSTQLPMGIAQESQGINPDTGDSQTSPTGADPQQQRPENPTDRDPQYAITHELHEEPATHTWQGIPILNCADDPFDPPVMVQRPRAVITLTKNYSKIKFDWLEQFVGSVNALKWCGRRKRTCRMDAIDYVAKRENGVLFWAVTFKITINALTWDHFLIERGWNYKKLVGSDWVKTPVPIPTDTSGRHSDVVPLLNGARASGTTYSTDYVVADDGTSGGIKDGSNPAITNVVYLTADNDGTKGRGQVLAAGSAPYYTRWRILPEKNFKLLGIG